MGHSSLNRGIPLHVWPCFEQPFGTAVSAVTAPWLVGVK